MNLVSKIKYLFNSWKVYRKRIAEEKEEKFLNMTDEEARKYFFPVFRELGAVKEGRLMDEWRKRKAARGSREIL